jgi:hypothetical protein
VTESGASTVSIGSASDWADAACTPTGGAGLVARVGSVVLVAAPAGDDALAPILDHAQIVAANGGSGRQLVRGFALQLSMMNDDPPAFVAAAPIDRGLAVFAVGEGTADVDGQEISGRDSLAWVEKVVPWPIGKVSLYVGGAPVAGSGLLDLRDGVIAAGGCILAAEAAAPVAHGAAARAPGAVAAAGQAELEPQDMGHQRRLSEPRFAEPAAPLERPTPEVAAASAVPAAPAAPAPPAAPAVPAPPAAPAVPAPPAAPAPPAPPAAPAPPAPAPAPAATDEEADDTGPIAIARPPVARRPDFSPEPAAEDEFESILVGPGDFGADSVPTPLPVVERAGRSKITTDSSPVVKGVFCKNGHFNDPRMLFCAVCGINMVQQTPVLVDGARPPLGVLVLDDGAVFQLDADYLLGREPDVDERVLRRGWRAIPLADSQQAISRVHARIELRQWDVVLVDDNSTNGTFYADPKTAKWIPVPRGGEQVLQPGWRIRVGHRTLAFNTHRG